MFLSMLLKEVGSCIKTISDHRHNITMWHITYQHALPNNQHIY